MEKEFYVYKYVSTDGRIVYIGKSESLFERIKQHKNFQGIDEKFRQYKDARIFAHKCSSRHEMDALEILLIEAHKPELNVACKTASSLSFSFQPDLKWIDVECMHPQHDQAKARKTVSDVEKEERKKRREAEREARALMQSAHNLAFGYAVSEALCKTIRTIKGYKKANPNCSGLRIKVEYAEAVWAEVIYVLAECHIDGGGLLELRPYDGYNAFTLPDDGWKDVYLKPKYGNNERKLLGKLAREFSIKRVNDDRAYINNLNNDLKGIVFQGLRKYAPKSVRSEG